MTTPVISNPKQTDIQQAASPLCVKPNSATQLSLTFDAAATPPRPVLDVVGNSAVSTRDKIRIDIDRAAKILIANRAGVPPQPVVKFSVSSATSSANTAPAAPVKPVLAMSPKGPVPVHPIYSKLNHLHIEPPAHCRKI